MTHVLVLAVAPFALIGLLAILVAVSWIAIGYTRITFIGPDGSAFEIVHVRGTLFEQRARRYNRIVRDHGYMLLGPGVHVHDTRFGIIRSASREGHDT